MSVIKELYKFTEGSNVWTLTSSDSDEDYDGYGYISTAIGRNNINVKRELSKSNIEVTISIDNALGTRWLENNPNRLVNLTIIEKEDTTYSTIWKGRLISVKPNGAESVLTFESIFTSLRLPGLRKRYQRSCPYALYGRGCNLDKATFKVVTTFSNITGNVVTCTDAGTYDDDYFTGGMIEDTAGDLCFIIDHVGDQLTLIRAFPLLSQQFVEEDYNINLYPGCDRLKDTCDTKFSNILNFGGFPFIPVRNPFGGTSIV